jgi:putative drug exporter of the RND superfamily
MPRFSIGSRLIRRWMLLVAVLVIAVVGFAVYRLNGIFGSKDVTSTPSGSVELFWIVLALAVILLLAVGSDYNLLLISRFKEEIGAGLKTGIIRAMAGSGAVVTAAGLVFGATMASFMFSDLRILGQIGTTIALGLLFDTLIVRSFMTPSIAALIGRWFWWPQNVRPRPARRTPQPRQAGRQLPLWEDEGAATTSEMPPR